MNELITSLKQLDISEEESIIYITILEVVSSTVLEISQKTNIPRTTVYLLIESLISKGLLKEVTEGKKKKYQALPPEQILQYAKNKKDSIVKIIDKLEKDVPQLQALYSLNQDRPKLTYSEGVKEVQKIMKMSLKYDSIYYWFTSTVGRDLLEEYIDQYRVELQERLIHSIEITDNSKENQYYKKQHETQRNQIILLPSTNITEVDQLLFGDIVVFITYKNNLPQCTIIQDKHIAYFEKIKLQMSLAYCKEMYI